MLLGVWSIYNFLSQDMRLSEKEIGIDIGQVPEIPLLVQWLDSSSTAGWEMAEGLAMEWADAHGEE